jgi:hypothetical protein
MTCGTTPSGTTPLELELRVRNYALWNYTSETTPSGTMPSGTTPSGTMPSGTNPFGTMTSETTPLEL